MQVSVETKDGLERIMTVELPASELDDEVKTRLQSLSRTTKLNGFRPGKVPFSVIQQRYGAQVNAEVLNEKIQRSFYEAVVQEKLQPAGTPEIKPVTQDDKEKVVFSAEFEVYPEISIVAMDSAEFEKPLVKIEEADIDSTIENIQKQHQHFHDVEREIQENDKVTTDFVGTIDSEAFKGNEGKSVPVTIGSKQMIAGFEDGLIGAKAGDELNLNLNFPEDYHYEEVAGKPVDFKVNVIKVEEPHLPELDEEFFKMFGVTEGGVEAFRAEVKKNMQVELDRNIAAKEKNDVMDKILEFHKVDVPKALVTEEAKSIAAQMRQQYQIQTPNEDDVDLTLFEEQAKRRVSLGLILADIVKQNELKNTPEEIKARVEELAESYENPPEVVEFYMGNKERQAEIESLLLEEKVVAWVHGQAKVSEKEFTFTEFMSPEK